MNPPKGTVASKPDPRRDGGFGSDENTVHLVRLGSRRDDRAKELRRCRPMERQMEDGSGVSIDERNRAIETLDGRVREGRTPKV